MEEDILADVAMRVILHAGDARNIIRRIGDALSNNDFSNVEQDLEKAKEELLKAHRIQTEVLQQESRQGTVEMSLLFVHAQDTLMTTESECFFVETLYNMFKHDRG